MVFIGRAQEKTNLLHDLPLQQRGRHRVVHADRGTSMTSKSVAALLDDLEVTRSHSRPRVSNDNPYVRHEVA